MKITDEMVVKAAEAIKLAASKPMVLVRGESLTNVLIDGEVDLEALAKAAFDVFAPMIARAEAEECAAVADESAATDREMDAPERLRMMCILTAKTIGKAIRARHATPDDSIPQEK